MPGKWQLLIFLGQQTILNMQGNGDCCIGAELLSIEPWNTGAGRLQPTVRINAAKRLLT